MTATMPITRVRGVNVDFPHSPYDCQLVYMEKVIEALQTRKHALLESPTGTGKVPGPPVCVCCVVWRLPHAHDCGLVDRHCASCALPLLGSPPKTLACRHRL